MCSNPLNLSKRLFGILFLFFSLNAFSQVTIYSEDFESSFGGWTITSTGSGAGNWLNGSDTDRATGATGNYVYSELYRFSRWDYYYNNDTYITATSPTIDMTGYSNISFSFDIWYNTEAGWDGMKVEYSLDNGTNWNALGSVSTSWYNDSGVDAFNSTEDGWSGDSGGWVTSSINLSTEDAGFDGNSQVQIRVLFASDGSTTDIGVAFDTVLIEGYPPSGPEINITGLGNTIATGDITPTTTDDTDFGSTPTGNTIDKTFTIQNLGTSTLNLSGTPIVSISGDAAFTILTQPSAASIASGGTDLTFVVRFAPTLASTVIADISIANDDSNENPYTFRVQGTGYTPAPEINVTGNGTNIPDGNTAISTTDDTDFGSVDIASGSASHTFTIENLGSLDLDISSITSNNVDFTISSITVPATVTSGSTTTFIITFNPIALGTSTATITINNNDSDENPYTFNVEGVGVDISTLCGTTIATFPYSEDFESGIGSWTQDTGDDLDWIWQTGGTDTNNTGPSGAASGSYYMYVEASINGVGYPDKTANIETPCFDLTGTTNPRATFFYHMFGADIDFNNSNNNVNYMGTLNVDISTDGGLTYPTNLWTYTGYIQLDELSSWIPLSFDLSTYIGQTVKFRIQGITASDYRSDFAIDNFTVTDKPNPTIAPGGVTSDLSIWLKADGGHSYTDGQPVSLWEDQGLASNVKTHKTGQEPTYKDNAISNVNFNPVIEFDNPYASYTEDTDYSHDLTTNSQFLTGDYGLYTQEMFIVLIPDDTPITNSFGFMDVYCADSDLKSDEADATGIGFGYYTGRIDGEIIAYAHSTYNNNDPGDGYAVAEIGTGSSYTNIGIINTRNNTADTQQELYYNANDIETTQNDIAEYMNSNDARFWLGRSEGWESSLNARVVEVISYSARKTDTDLTQERNRIQSYLAIKYGITLGVNGTSQDYVDSDGTVIWDVNTGVAADDIFNYDIAGIGRDDASGLNQKQSKSVNETSDGTGLLTGILTMGLTDIYTTNSNNISANATVFGDKEFLVWGNNGTSITSAPFTVNVDMSIGIGDATLTTPVTFDGMQRIWKVVETGGDVSSVKVSIPQNAVRNISPPGSYLMFISSTDVFDPTADYRVMTLDGSGNLETTYDFDGTKFITFGYAPEVVVERSIQFDGTNDYIDIGNYKDLNALEFTISAWIKRSVGSDGTTILSKRDAAYTEGYNFGIDNLGQFEMSWNGGAESISSSIPIPENEWHHLAIIFDTDTANLYIDGVLDQTATSLATPAATTQSFLIAAAGKTATTDFYKGNIDEVRVWNIALTENQLRYIINQEIEDNAALVKGLVIPNGITKDEVGAIAWSDLAGYYPMSIYTYTNTKDHSDNNNQGALRNLDTVDWQTAPLPYVSETDGGTWDTPATWLNNTVQNLPNSLSIIDGITPINWNIVEISHNISSGDKDITVLGMISNTGTLTIADPVVTSPIENNDGQSLTITHYLELDGSIDLVGESQLIQTEGSVLDNDSGGFIERDQQGTANSYNYNYWSSSVSPISGNTATKGTGVASVNSSVSLFGVLKDGTTSSNPVGITFDTSYTAADSGPSIPITISTYWLYKFYGADSDYSAWAPLDENSLLLPGEGYTMKGTSGATAITNNQNYVFKGKPNNGDITLPFDNSVQEVNRLIGNPYPSAIDAVEFINDNINNMNGAVYFWDHFGENNSHNLGDYVGGYATRNLTAGAPAISNDVRINNDGSTGTKIPGQYIPVGQGFFVISEVPITPIITTEIVFKNSQRAFVTEASASSVFMKGTTSKNEISSNNTLEDTRPIIRLLFHSPKGYYRQIVVGIDKNATNSFDLGYDAPIADIGEEDMFWIFNESKFVIQAVNNFNEDQELPLGLIVNETGLVSIKIDELKNIDEHIDYYIKDKLTEETFEITTEPFEMNLEAGTYLDRFVLVFQPRLKTLEEIELFEGIHIYMNNTSSEIQLDRIVDTEVLNVTLFNYLGQQVHSWNSNLSERLVSLPIYNKSTGVYIVKVTTSAGVITKKIIIQ